MGWGGWVNEWVDGCVGGLDEGGESWRFDSLGEGGGVRQSNLHCTKQRIAGSWKPFVRAFFKTHIVWILEKPFL